MEEQLVKKAIKGNKKAFDSLIKTYSHEAYRLAYYYLKHPADSQDALGFAIEKAYKSIHTLIKTDSFKPWLMTIVVNEAKMILRRKRAQKVIPLDALIENREIAEASAEASYVDKEAVMDLEQALDRLPEEDRSLLMMKHYEGYTFKEIAFVLNMPESTVKSRHYALLKTLRHTLEGEEVQYDRQRQ